MECERHYVTHKTCTHLGYTRACSIRGTHDHKDSRNRGQQHREEHMDEVVKHTELIKIIFIDAVVAGLADMSDV